MRRFVLTAALACAAFGQTKPPEGKPAETFYSQAQRAIFRLEHSEINLQTKQTAFELGTGFYVHTDRNNWYVITAAHVADAAFSYSATVPLALEGGDSAVARMVLPHDKWEFHSSAPDSEHFRIDG